ncbi:LCP family protein [Amycolatopsis cihanbeyliensis]|uniref:LytR family transcriptional attenuator n=1 Tax=Amycolatopsis cihanbeyliensis TaxID=1128664 RepID=A0A542DP89_AMYCI|nr:LCP family protein [Amycolatopsis cihanbeyliensis]TQJ04785.1 LytR family transcriptional attenuator [Amycolatopsis cihanbeyliensis]
MTDWPGRAVDRAGARGRSTVVVLALRGGKTLISLVSLIVLGLTWYGWQFVGDVNEGLATTNVFDDEMPVKPLDGAIDILLVGQDSRTDQQGNPLPREVLDMLHAGEADGERQTDTMILVHIPQNGKRAVAVSFPRDSWVRLAGGYGKHKLNGAFVYAYNDTHQTLQQQGMTDLEEIDKKAKIAGRKNLIKTIERLIGRPGMIDRYAEVNLASFYEITKALGGIKVCLKEPVEEYRSGIDLPAGEQTIEGVQALAFVRQRYGLPRSDLDRIARQQAFLSGLARKVLSTEVLMNPSKLSDLVGAVKKSVVLSERWDLLEFAAQMRGLSGGNVEFHTIPVVGNAEIGGADVIQVDVDEVRSFMDEIVGEEPSTTPPATGSVEASDPSEVTVDVYNGSGQATLGSQVRGLLREKGFQGSGSATATPVSNTVVRHPPGEEDNVAALREALGQDFETEQDGEIPSGRLHLVLGSDYTGTSAGEPSNASHQAPGRTDRTRQGTSDEHTEEPITADGVPCVN